MIDRLTIARIMDATNIVEVVSDFVTLKKAGVNYRGLCPFHDDTTPSFMVSPSKGICHCFACGEGGNAVNFLMKHEQISYPDALRWLAKKYSIEIKEKELTEEEQQADRDREAMFNVNEWANEYFKDILHNDVDGQAIGKQYFRSRGIRDDIMAKFSLGFAPQQRDATAKAALKKGYKEEYLTKTGLCIKSERNGELFDRYSGRVIFPWFNVSGKVVAFGGRLLDSRTKGVQQKYVNSPDSDIYHKERELYGIFQAKKAIAKADLVYMVEGYTDVIAMHQCGIENVVANSGTALSYHQIRLLKRFTQNVVLLYDGDEAGIKAAMRGTDMMLEQGMNVKVMLLPDGDDPDSFARKHTADEFRDYIEKHKQDFIEFEAAQLLNGVNDPIKRAEAIKTIVKSISVIPEPITRDTYVHVCAELLHVREQTIVVQMNDFIAKAREEKLKQPQGIPGERNAENTQETPGTSTVSASSTTSTISTTPTISTNSETQTPIPPQHSTPSIETELAKCLVRYGGMTIYDNVETEDGETITLSVAQYIAYDMAQDGLTFTTDTYNKMLEEAAEESLKAAEAHQKVIAEIGPKEAAKMVWEFDSMRHFTQHPDLEISNMAGHLAIDRYELTGSRRIELKGNDLRRYVEHLMLDFRHDLVDQRLKSLLAEMKTVGNDSEALSRIMAEYNDLRKLRDLIGKKIGR